LGRPVQSNRRTSTRGQPPASARRRRLGRPECGRRRSSTRLLLRKQQPFRRSAQAWAGVVRAGVGARDCGSDFNEMTGSAIVRRPGLCDSARYETASVVSAHPRFTETWEAYNPGEAARHRQHSNSPFRWVDPCGQPPLVPFPRQAGSLSHGGRAEVGPVRLQGLQHPGRVIRGRRMPCRAPVQRKKDRPPKGLRPRPTGMGCRAPEGGSQCNPSGPGGGHRPDVISAGGTGRHRSADRPRSSCASR